MKSGSPGREILPEKEAFYFLPQAFFIHGLLDLIGGVFLFVYPDIFITTNVVVEDSPAFYFISIFAAALLMVGVLSLRGSYSRNWTEYANSLNAKVMWSGFVVAGNIIYFIRLGETSSTVPWPLGVIFGIFIVGFIVWGTYRIIVAVRKRV